MMYALDHLANYPRVSFLKQWGMYNSKLPAIFGSDLKFWVSATFSDQYVQSTGPGGTPVSDGAPVGWIEELVSGYHLSQAVTANKSTYRASHANFNSRPAWDFDGGDWYQRAFGVTYNQPNTVLAVAKATGVLDAFLHDGDMVGPRYITAIISNKWYINSGVARGGLSANTNTNVFFALFNGASSKLYVNGLSAIAFCDAGSNNTAGITVASLFGHSSYFWLGQIAELAIINSIPTGAQLNAVGQEWAKYYGISYTPV